MGVRWGHNPLPDALGYDAAREDRRFPGVFGQDVDHARSIFKRAVVLHGKDGRPPAASAPTNQGARNGGDAPGLTQPADPRLLPGTRELAASPGSAAVRGGERPSTTPDVNAIPGSLRDGA